MANPYRYFRVDPAAYPALTAYVDTSREYPNETTERGLQLFEDLVHEEDGWGLLPVDTWRFNDDDEVVIADAIAAGTVEELDMETYRAKREAVLSPPIPEPEPEPPELPPEPEPPELPPEPEPPELPDPEPHSYPDPPLPSFYTGEPGDWGYLDLPKFEDR